MTASPGPSARNLKATGILCLIVLCTGMILTAGCTESAGAGIETTAASPVSGAAAALSSTRSLPASLILDPIVGSWWSPGPGYLFRISFFPDGTTQETFANQPGFMYNGTWQAAGNNQYLVTRGTGTKTVWVYTPDTNTLAKQAAPGIVYSLYQGTNDAATAFFAGNSSTVIPFTATSPGTWAFTLGSTCEGNYIVWLTDSAGCRVALLANKIGTSSVIGTQKLGEGKYYLDVTAGGPWTIQAALSS